MLDRNHATGFRCAAEKSGARCARRVATRTTCGFCAESDVCPGKRPQRWNRSRSLKAAACGWPPRRAYRAFRSCGRVAEGGGLLNRYRVVKPYRGFESLRLRGSPLYNNVTARRARRAPDIRLTSCKPGGWSSRRGLRVAPPRSRRPTSARQPRGAARWHRRGPSA